MSVQLLFLVDSEILPVTSSTLKQFLLPHTLHNMVYNHKDRIEQYMLTERRKDTSMH